MVEWEAVYVSSYNIVKYDDCKIIRVEEFPCSSKDELRAREQYYIDNNGCVNKVNAFLTDEERKQNQKESHKIYCEQNKEKIREIDRKSKKKVPREE